MEPGADIAPPRSVDERHAIASAAFFWLRLALLLGLTLACWKTGAGAWLAGRVSARFPGGGGLWGYALFAGMCVLSYEVLLFPLAWRANAVLSPLSGGDGRAESFGAWLRGYLLSLALETLTLSAAAGMFWALYRLAGAAWWVFGAVAYRVVSPEWWAVAVRVQSRRLVPVEADVFLEKANRALASEGLRQADGVAVFDGGEWEAESFRAVHYAYRFGRKRPALVFLRPVWEGLGEEARLFLALQEGRLRRWRWWSRWFAMAETAAVLALAGWVAEAVARSEGWAGVASPEALPVLVASLFAAASAGGLACNAAARRGQRVADRTACRALGGTGAMRAWVRETAGEGARPMRLPWWALALQDGCDGTTRLEAAERHGAAAAGERMVRKP